MTSKLYAIVAGVGPGTGAAVAHKFAKAYPVVLLARKPESYNSLVDEIKAQGGFALGVSTDVSSEDSIKNAFKVIDQEFGQDSSCAVG